MMVGIIVSILAGGTIVVSRIINAKLAERIGTLQSTLFNYIVGLLISILFLFVMKDKFILFTISPQFDQSWIYIGGLVGVLTILISNVVSLKLSTFNATLFIFIGQLFAGMFIDYMILKQFSIYQFFGGILVLFGLIYNLSIDKKENNVEKK